MRRQYGLRKFFLEKLQKSGFRLTPQREMVLTILHQLADFATAEEIYRRVQRLSSSVTISTVYRTLELLQNFRLVARVDSADGQHLYALLAVEEAPHLHLVCHRCGQITGVDLKYFEPFMSDLIQQYGFEVDVKTLHLTGLCRQCRAVSDETGNERRPAGVDLS